MRISDWSSAVWSSDLPAAAIGIARAFESGAPHRDRFGKAGRAVGHLPGTNDGLKGGGIPVVPQPAVEGFALAGRQLPFGEAHAPERRFFVSIGLGIVLHDLHCSSCVCLVNSAVALAICCFTALVEIPKVAAMSS